MKKSILILIFLIPLCFNLTASASFINAFGEFGSAHDAIETTGNIGQLAIPIAALITTLVRRDYQGSWQLGKAYGATIAAVYILKPIVNRKRPDGGSWSFPSGHTASAFAGAAFFQRRYGWEYGIPAYIFAGFVGYSRVYAKRHWTTDVLAGAALGIAANFIFTKPYHHVAISPYIGKDSAGLDVSFG